jgi:cell division septation protein DedD
MSFWLCLYENVQGAIISSLSTCAHVMQCKGECCPCYFNVSIKLSSIILNYMVQTALRERLVEVPREETRPCHTCWPAQTSSALFRAALPPLTHAAAAEKLAAHPAVSHSEPPAKKHGIRFMRLLTHTMCRHENHHHSLLSP